MTHAFSPRPRRQGQVLVKVVPRGRRRLTMAAVVVLGVSGAALARASIVRALDLPELVQQADHVAVVDVVSLRSDWDSKHERILSTVELKVVERWKGPAAAALPDDHLTIVQPGGTVGDLSMTVTGLSTFTPGERAVVFLRGAANNARVLGMGQGKRPMHYDAAAHTWWIKAAGLRDLTVVKSAAPTGATTPFGNAPSSFSPSSSPSSPSKISSTPVQPTSHPAGLDDFRAQVRALLGTPAR